MSTQQSNQFLTSCQASAPGYFQRSALYFLRASHVLRDTVYEGVYVMTRDLLTRHGAYVTHGAYRPPQAGPYMRPTLATLRHFVSSCRGDNIVRHCGTGNHSDSCHVTSGCHSGSGFIMGVAILFPALNIYSSL